MFELNDNLDVQVVRNIGPQKKSAVVIDNFYKNPDEIRQLALTNSKNESRKLCTGFPGVRVFVDTLEVRENVGELLLKLCLDESIWNKKVRAESLLKEFKNLRFLVNILNDESLKKYPIGSVPHQDCYEQTTIDRDVNSVFGAVIYLNTPDECAGGTSLYSLNGQMTVPNLDSPWILQPLDGRTEDEMSSEEVYNHIKHSMKTDGFWELEHTFEMVYNRFVLYDASVLHSQEVDLGMFTEHDRINQVIFL